jgi:hypothetical protein
VVRPADAVEIEHRQRTERVRALRVGRRDELRAILLIDGSDGRLSDRRALGVADAARQRPTMVRHVHLRGGLLC